VFLSGTDEESNNLVRELVWHSKRATRFVGETKRPAGFVALEPLIARFARNAKGAADLCEGARIVLADSNDKLQFLSHRISLIPGHVCLRVASMPELKLLPMSPEFSVTYVSGLYPPESAALLWALMQSKEELFLLTSAPPFRHSSNWIFPSVTPALDAGVQDYVAA
jgi:hypothetical protein